MSDRLGIPPRLAPFADAVFAILLDLSLDAIAIRQGLWHWNIPLHAGFFGFSAWTRWVRAHGRQGSAWLWLQWLVPVPAYLTLLVALVPFIVLQQRFFGGPTGGFPTFLLTLALFVVLSGYAIRRTKGRLPHPWVMPLLPRLMIHGYFLGAGLLLGIFQQLPVLLAM